MSLTRPNTIHYAFAVNATAGYINTVPDAPTGSYLASWQQGFPPVTMTPLGSGGSPPSGADFNGALNLISANVQWFNAGGHPIYDASLSTAQGGYPANAVISLDDGVTMVINTSGTDNPNNPNTGGPGVSGWSPYSGPVALAGNYGTTGGTSTAYTLTCVPALYGQVNGSRIAFKLHATNTGACTLTVNGTGAPLVRNDGAALVAGDIVSGKVYTAIYDKGSSSWRIIQNTQSQGGSIAYVTDTGAANAYAVTLTPPVGAYTNGLTFIFKAANANTTASTLNAGAGAVALVNAAGQALNAGDIVAGAIYEVVYDSGLNKFLMLTGSSSNPKLFSNFASDPATTSSAGKVMMGLGSGWAFTPTRTGRLLVMAGGQVYNDNVSAAVGVDLRYGTGAAPANGTAATGTVIGQTNGTVLNAHVGNAQAPYTVNFTITGLSVGTPYWFDWGIQSFSGGNCGVVKPTITIMEI